MQALRDIRPKVGGQLWPVAARYIFDIPHPWPGAIRPDVYIGSMVDGIPDVAFR